jgi:hypothetical protein
MARAEPGHMRPMPQKDLLGELWNISLNENSASVERLHPLEGEVFTDDEALLATPIVYGYSLTEKLWCE